VGSEESLLFELTEATFDVQGRRLLQPLSLTLDKHRLIGLIGHNGSGKSTLLKLLARQQSVSGGSILCDGRPLSSWRSREFARKVAFLPQKPPPAYGMLVSELVALGRYPWHGAFGQFGDADRRQVSRAMTLTDVACLSNRLVETLSGGELQRVWLAMLLAQDTQCLLLDEPTAALDVLHQVELLTLVQKLNRESGLSIVIVLHDINMAARVCDELIALHGGRVLTRGTPAEIMTTERLEEIYGLPLGIVAHPVTGVPISYVR
jgi:ferric hydroxamate transport system ATP-binding protein